jgi:hypothetical protein
MVWGGVAKAEDLPMRQILVDTSALCALANRGDRNHQSVAGFVRNQSEQTVLIVTDYVLDEMLTWVKARFGAQPAIELGERVRSSDFCRFTRLTADDEMATWEIFKRYTDEEWSYTDCSCLAVMRKLGIDEALSTDHHFVQMGVVMLP